MGQQYLDNGWIPITITLTMVCLVLFNIYRAHGGDLFIRRIAGLNAIDEAVGRATEMGRPVIMVPGISSPVNAKTMQAINIFAYVSRIAARFASPILVCCNDATVLTVCQEVIRDVYIQEGLADQYDVDSVRFITDRQFAFAAGVAGIILRERPAAAFLMGEFYAESLILAETANSVAAIQVASSTELTQTPFFIAACDYVLIGDEYYAASAFLTRQPVLVGSLVGQDWCKMTIAAMILIGLVANSYQLSGGSHHTITQEWNAGKFEALPKPKPFGAADTSFSRWFNPDPATDIKIDRPKLPPDELPQPAPGGGG